MKKEKREIEEEYKVLAETSPDCIKLIDVDGDLLYINPAGLEEHGFESLEEAKNRSWRISDDIIEKDIPKFEKAFQDALKGKISSVEIRHDEDSSRNVCLETMAPVKDENGEIVAIFGVSRDISSLKKTEDDLRKIKNELEIEVENRTKELKEKIKELEELNEIMTGRELRMIELKDEIRKLKDEARKNETD